MSVADPGTALIGRSLPRVDARAKVTGRARYSAEYHPDRLAYAALVEATVPAGTIRTIDTHTAENAPGVLAILTHLNAPRLPYGAVTPRPAVEPASGHQLRVLQGPHVEFCGQPIGVVVADSQARADLSDILRRADMQQVEENAAAEPGEEQKTHVFYSFGAVFAEVRVDPDLYTIRVLRLFGACDIGRVVNPKLAHSQCIGGMVGGLGMALLEDTEWDETLGRVANASLAEYLLPVCADVVDLDATFVPSPEPLANPLGTKGVAELGLCGVAPAIANAVWHATGLRVRDLPITLDKLFAAAAEQ